MDELIAHVFEKTYAYGAIRAENQNLLFTISELKTRLANVEKGMNAASSVRRPMNRDSHVKNSVLANSKKPAKKVAVYVRKNKQTDNTFENVISNKENVIDVDVANASKVVQIVLWIVDSGCSKHMTGDRSLLKIFIEKFMGTIRFRNDNFADSSGYAVAKKNLYTISISDMAASLPVSLMSKATSTKSWLWHRRLSHLNFGSEMILTRLDLVDGTSEV
ncbi:integrase, catalytic region, zinc finger, CCHC-type containing protein [Tanacetum coccineum]|uniref:Integrase, catalytic region, zinc finger, CCHC-type containing protein n=1 Tax=Tanacetum coccineum TaxID=301880 RepID=A0ABQ5G865_9ASTR